MKRLVLFLLFLSFTFVSAAETPALILTSVRIYPKKMDLKEQGRWIRISDESYIFLPSDSSRMIVKSFRKVVIQDSRAPKIFADLSKRGKVLSTSVIFYFHADDAKRFYELTKENIGKPIACFVGETFFSAPIIHAPISGGMAQIVGDFNEKQMKLIRQLEMQKN